MSRGLLRYERAVLESLGYGPKTIDQLKDDIGINRDILLNILSYFIMESVVGYKREVYSLSKEACSRWIEQHDSKQGKVQEVIELIESSMINHLQSQQHEGHHFLFRKVWMEEDDRIVHDRLVQSYYQFISYLEQKQKEKKLHKNNRLVSQEVILSLCTGYVNTLSESNYFEKNTKS
jgi:hypothetical protein